MTEGVALGEGQAVDPWWQAELARLRGLTDPLVDEAIKQYRKARPDLNDPRTLVRAVIADLAQAKAEGPAYVGPLRGLSDIWLDLPAWGQDEALLRRGQDVFNDRGLDMGASLCFASLPLAYATVDGAEVLARTSDLATQNVTRRVGETGRMLIDVMGTRGENEKTLAKGGPGYNTAIGVRLLHGCVRSLMQDPGSPPWPAPKFGPPLNQEILLATLMDFTLVTWKVVERMGDPLSDDERRAHLYTWSVVGHLMGLEACRTRALELADIDKLVPLLSRHLGASEAGRRLMEGLLGMLEGFMPLGWRKMPRSVVHWLFKDGPYGSSEVPMFLAVPAPAWWSRPLFAALRWAKSTRWLAPVRLLVGWIVRRSGRLIILALVDGLAPESPPFQIPKPLRRSWRLRTGRVATRVRRVRHSARTRVRAVGLRRRTLRST